MRLEDFAGTKYLRAPADPARITRADVAASAVLLKGVPFRHQGSDPRSGLDCRGVIEFQGFALFNRPIPERDYQRSPNGYEFRDKLRAELEEIAPAEARSGDIVLIRFPKDPADEAKHGGILVAGPYELMLVHAWEYKGPGEVIEEPFRGWKERNVLHAFKFPVAD